MFNIKISLTPEIYYLIPRSIEHPIIQVLDRSRDYETIITQYKDLETNKIRQHISQIVRPSMKNTLLDYPATDKDGNRIWSIDDQIQKLYNLMFPKGSSKPIPKPFLFLPLYYFDEHAKFFEENRHSQRWIERPNPQ